MSGLGATPPPSPTGAVFGVTAGISRNMQTPVEPAGAAVDAPALTQGGGNLNGSQALVYLGQTGTAGQRISVQRLPPNSGNYCGIV